MEALGLARRSDVLDLAPVLLDDMPGHGTPGKLRIGKYSAYSYSAQRQRQFIMTIACVAHHLELLSRFKGRSQDLERPLCRPTI